MRKAICTASIFVVMMAAVVALVVVQVPDQVWWWPSPSDYEMGCTSVLSWIVGNVLVPAGVVIGVPIATIGIIYCLWGIASDICALLRGDT